MDHSLEPTLEPVASMLDQAADYMEQNGWVQGHACTKAGEVCLMGALSMVDAYDSTAAPFRALVALRGSLALDYGPLGSPEGVGAAIVDYNDRVLSEPGQAVDALRWAAKRVRAGDL